MIRLILGLLKGAVLGGGVGYGAYAAGLGGGFNWVTYGLVGLVVGLFVGKPLWSILTDRSSTIWTAILKGIFGFGVGIGLYAIVAKAWGGFDVSLFDETRLVQDWQFILGGAIGGLYGAFIELDDSVGAAEKKPAQKPAAD